jgi:tetratricopeptide (TPR) repeat protein
MDIDEEYEDVFERWEACETLAEWQESVEGEIDAMDLVRLGEALKNVGRYEEERAAYEEALAKDPNCSEAHGHLALSYYAGPLKQDIVRVIHETEKFMKTSPYQAELRGAMADFAVYGELRILRAALKKELSAAGRAAKARDYKKTASILEEATARDDIPDAYRTLLYTEAGKFRLRARDVAGARAAFENALKHAACQKTIEAHLGLASLDVKAGEFDSAIAHLEAAVKEGSAACEAIAERRDTVFKPLFEHEDQKIREKMEKLADVEFGDEPIRKGIRAAVDRARKEGKKVILYFYGPYCPYVMAMQERLVRPEVKKVLDEKFVVYRVDYGSHHRAVSIDSEYGDVFECYGVPSFVVLNDDGSVHSVKTDADLFGTDQRDYAVGNIVEWLNRTATTD